MYKDRKILGLIPARGGSRGLPGKNVKPLLGKPLIAWTVEQARAAELLDRVMVDTDSPQIAEAAKAAGAQVPFLRPAELALDTSPVIDTVLHVLEVFEKEGERYDYLALLEPTSPLRKPGDIDRGIRMLIGRESEASSLVSVGEIALEHPLYAKKISPAGLVQAYGGDTCALRQALPKAYFPYGVLYLSRAAAIREHHAVYPEPVLAMTVERWQNYEINDIWDFLCVETVMKERMG